MGKSKRLDDMDARITDIANNQAAVARHVINYTTAVNELSEQLKQVFTALDAAISQVKEVPQADTATSQPE